MPPLTVAAVKNAAPASKTSKLFDGGGLYLEVAPSGSKWWRLKYRFGGKEKRLALGVYPDVSLKAAREKRDEARKLIASGVDPSENRKAKKPWAASERPRSSITEMMVDGRNAIDPGCGTGSQAVKTKGSLRKTRPVWRSGRQEAQAALDQPFALEQVGAQRQVRPVHLERRAGDDPRKGRFLPGGGLVVRNADTGGAGNAAYSGLSAGLRRFPGIGAEGCREFHHPGFVIVAPIGLGPEKAAWTPPPGGLCIAGIRRSRRLSPYIAMVEAATAWESRYFGDRWRSSFNGTAIGRVAKDSKGDGAKANEALSALTPLMAAEVEQAAAKAEAAKKELAGAASETGSNRRESRRNRDDSDAFGRSQDDEADAIRGECGLLSRTPS